MTMLPGGQKLEVHSDGLDNIGKAIEFVRDLTAPKTPASPFVDIHGCPFDLEAGLLYMAPVTIDKMTVGHHPVVVVPIEIEADPFSGTWKLTAVVLGGDDRYEITGELGTPHSEIHKLTDCCRDIIT
jgi:hypothetical protein